MRALGWMLVAAALGAWVAFLAAASPPIAALVYLPVGALTALLYGLDKARARRGARRIPERTLHLLELAGGWAGAFWAQQQLRHKTRDRRFQLWFWLIGLVHLGAWLAWFRLRAS